MIKTYPDFLAVCDSKCALYAQIPEGHLSFEGTKVYEIYRTVKFNACFADSAADLLSLIADDSDVNSAAEYAASEFRQIKRCLERLAAAENTPTT